MEQETRRKEQPVYEAGPLEESKDGNRPAVAHGIQKLRTPLNGIWGNLRLLQDTQLNTEQRRMMELILQGCRNMASMIDDILDACRLEAGTFALRKKEFGLRNMLNGIIDANIAAINEKGLHLMLHVPEDIPEYVSGDEACIAQILNQLFSSAIKDTAAGYVSLELEMVRETEKDQELLFMVKDTGVGFSKEEGRDCFGLSLALELAKRLGGEIYLSGEEGKGSAASFRICLDKSAAGCQEHKDSRDAAALFWQWDEGTGQLENAERYVTFGTQENIREIRSKMEKLMICLELEAWDHAEHFAGNLKALLQKREDLAKMVFRLELCLRREDYEKSMQKYQELKAKLEGEII